MIQSRETRDFFRVQCSNCEIEMKKLVGPLKDNLYWRYIDSLLFEELAAQKAGSIGA